MPNQIDELQDHMTAASNTTGQLNMVPTAMSVGLSPNNRSMQRRGQRSEALFYNRNRDAMSGSGNILNNYESTAGTAKGFQITKGNRFNQTAKLISTRRTDPKARSAMPKNAVNYYNLRKGLYLKNGSSRKDNTSRSTSRIAKTKSVGILNAYGELANMTP